jgi:acetyl-CoA acetyltransferase
VVLDNVWVIGASMTRFGRFDDRDIIDIAAEAGSQALRDAQLDMRDMNVLTVGNIGQADKMVAQRLQAQIGQTGIPAYNVANACATGASALRFALLELLGGGADLGLVVGVEVMGKAGLIGIRPPDKDRRFEPRGRFGAVTSIEGLLGTATMPGVFAQVGIEYAGQHDGIGAEQFAKVAVKNHRHSVLNPLAQYRKSYSLEEVLNAPMVAWPNSNLMCCPTGDGAAALVICSDARLRTMDPDIRRRAVKIAASEIRTTPWSEGDAVLPDINTPTRQAADAAYEAAGLGPGDLDLVELHDCFATAELVHYDNLRLCGPGEAGEFIDSGAPYRDGRIPVNVSGGLLSKGHPLGATGVAGIYEVVTHLRGEAGDRQVENARTGLAHVLGLGTVASVHILERRAA